MSFKLGLKLWSTNEAYIVPAKELYKQGIYDYIELYTVPNSFADYAKLWKQLDIPFVIHAAHEGHGFNLADKQLRQANTVLLAEAQAFANTLKAANIIIHPGLSGSLLEVSRQLSSYEDPRLTIENVPYLSEDGQTFVDLAPKDIAALQKRYNIQYCLDIGHAIYYANAKKIPYLGYIKQLLDLKPVLVHLTDGTVSGIYDHHDHYGHGDFPLQRLLGLLPRGIRITNEAEKDSLTKLEDVKKDWYYLTSLLEKA